MSPFSLCLGFTKLWRRIDDLGGSGKAVIANSMASCWRFHGMWIAMVCGTMSYKILKVKYTLIEKVRIRHKRLSIPTQINPIQLLYGVNVIG